MLDILIDHICCLVTMLINRQLVFQLILIIFPYKPTYSYFQIRHTSYSCYSREKSRNQLNLILSVGPVDDVLSLNHTLFDDVSTYLLNCPINSCRTSNTHKRKNIQLIQKEMNNQVAMMLFIRLTQLYKAIQNVVYLHFNVSE